MVLTKLFSDFFKSERAGGLLLILCTIVSLLIANLMPSLYGELWITDVGRYDLIEWINDGLMTVFFLLIGLELEREIYLGELSDVKNAMLPVLAAVGGMLLPASIYFLINIQGGNMRGIGIPMATDIAFALGVLSLLGKRVPSSLKVFLTAFAVIDDLGAVIIIAIFYTQDIHWLNLAISLGVFGALGAMNRLKVLSLWPYLTGGLVMWYFMHHSGVHATITGVLLAFAIPFGDGGEASPSYRLQHFLHRPVAFFILPLFALANTSIVIGSGFMDSFAGPISLGIMIALLAGKPLGIFLFSYAAVQLKWSSLPEDVDWKLVFGAGLLGGIGFTMSIFVALLAFEEQALIDQSKLSVMVVSLIAGVAGFAWLKIFLSGKSAAP